MTSAKPKLALLLNMIAPYRVAVLARLAERFDLHILHAGVEGNREWKEVAVPGAKHRRAWGWQIVLKRKRNGKLFNQRFVHLEPGYLTGLISIRPQAVISNEIGFRTLIALVYGFFFRVPVWVWWGGTLQTEERISAAQRLLRRLATATVRHWISYGDSSTEYLLSLGVERERILQIQNCVDESWFQGKAAPAMDLHPKPVLLHVGRFIALKGIDELLHAAATLQTEGHRFSLLFAGGGPDLNETRELAKKLGLENVHFLPSQPPEKMAAVYRSADVLIFPTLQDVWGLVANEAILSGIPVLCSKYAGCAEELSPPECIFDPADHDGFVNALRRAVMGNLPASDPARLLSSAQVAERIAGDIEAQLRAARAGEEGKAGERCGF
jgi:glycosyltransferase involved in cell wall biosynthesis